MAGRQGQNKGSKGKPGFQPVVGKGIKPPRTILGMKTTRKNSTSTTGEAENPRRQTMPRLCADPKVCGVKTHRAGTVCKAQQLMNKPQFRVDSKGKLFGCTPQEFVMLTVGEGSASRPWNKHLALLKATLIKEGLEIYDSQYDIGVEADYDYVYDCDAYGCNDEGICRCGQIVNLKVSLDDTERFATNILEYVQRYPNDKDVYALTNVLNNSDIHERGALAANISSGYYGEEVSRFYIDSKDAQEKVATFLTLSPDDRVRYGVGLSQGEIPEELYNKTFSVEQVDPNLVLFSDKINDPVFKVTDDPVLVYSLAEDKVNSVTKEVYADAKVKGVIVPLENGTYRIVDGFHRQAQTNMSQPAFYIVARGEK